MYAAGRAPPVLGQGVPHQPEFKPFPTDRSPKTHTVLQVPAGPDSVDSPEVLVLASEVLVLVSEVLVLVSKVLVLVSEVLGMVSKVLRLVSEVLGLVSEVLVLGRDLGVRT